MLLLFTFYWSKQIISPYLTSEDREAQSTMYSEGGKLEIVGEQLTIMQDISLELSGLRRRTLAVVEEDGVLIILFELLGPAVPEAGWLWAISLCETISSFFFFFFCLIQLDFLPYLRTERILGHILLNKQQTQTIFGGFEGNGRRQKDVNISQKLQFSSNHSDSRCHHLGEEILDSMWDKS